MSTFPGMLFEMAHPSPAAHTTYCTEGCCYQQWRAVTYICHHGGWLFMCLGSRLNKATTRLLLVPGTILGDSPCVRSQLCQAILHRPKAILAS